MENEVYSMKKEMLRRGLSQRTIQTYCYCLQQFFKEYNKNPRQITKKNIRDYLDRLIENNKAGSTINLHYSAIKFFMQEVLKRNIYLNFKLSRRGRKLPVVLTQQEIKQLFDAVDNKKHKLIVKLIYSAGLRVSELTHLKVKDFELKEDYGWVRKGKGRKDRLFIIAESLKGELEGFIKENNLDYDSYLFKGVKQRNISNETISLIIKKAAKKAGIKKNIHCHTLRHSFATHLIENGYSLQDVQNLLGHNSAQTTMVYIHMVKPRINIKSPIDSL